MQTFRLPSWCFSLLISALFFSCTSINSQTLKRTAFLGAQLSDLSVVEEENGAEYGLYLSAILPEGSLGKMNVPAKTVLQQINGNKIESFRDIGPALAQIKEGDDIKIQLIENQKVKSYKGIAVGKPKEKNDFATVEYNQVNYKDNRLRSILYLPNAIKNPPVVFFLQGYTCQSIEMRNNNPAKQLIDEWVKKGFAVYLVEKPGMGDSESTVPCMEIDFNQELHAFSQAYKSLQNNPKIDAENIFMFGHSMGGIIAPLLAQEKQPAGIMVYGIVGNNWYDYMKKIYTEQPLIFGTSQEQINQNSQYYLPFIKDLLVNKKTNTELINNPTYGQRLKDDGVATELENGYYIMRHYTYWQSLADVNVPATWSKVKSPVYVLHGEYDIQAIAPKYGELIVTNVNKNGGNASFELFPKSEHVFLQFNSREDHLQTLNSGNYVASFTTNFNKDIALKSYDWMKKQLNK